MKSQKLEKPFQFIVSLTLVLGGCALLVGTPWIENLIHQIIKTLKPGGIIFKAWQKYPPLFNRFYLFNWTNPEDLYNPNVKPHFTEVGPFVFEFQAEKTNITWNNNNSITFRNLRYWYFDEKRSEVDLSQKIVTINILLYFAAYRMRYWNSFIQRLSDVTLRIISTKMYMERTAGELLFDGYNDQLLNMANFVALLDFLKIPSQNKVGWLYQRNGSQHFEEYVNMETFGQNVGQIRQWNFMSEMPYYSNTCNEVKGSMSEFFPVPLSEKPVEIFWPDACRSFSFEFKEETIFRGFRAFKYSAKNAFDNGTKFSENRCYRVGEDVPTGAFNLSTCRYGAPVFVSLPHFYGADSSYLEGVEGLNPTKENHDAFLLLEPNTGTPLYGKVRVQANVLLQPYKYLSLFTSVPKVYIPVIWVEQEAELPAKYRILLRIYLSQKIILRTVAILGMLIGIVMFISSLWKEKLKAIYQNHGGQDKADSGKTVISKNEETNRLLTI